MLAKPVHFNNVWWGRGMKKVGIVCHTMGGSLVGTDGWFTNPSAQASTNYGIGTNGEIHVYIDPFGPDAPMANGLVRNPSGTFPPMYQAMGQVNPNFWTVSIEHEGYPVTGMQDGPMFKASVHLAAWLCQEFAIPADFDHFFSHTEIDSQKPDPGWDAAFWRRYIEAVKGQEEEMTPEEFSQRWTEEARKYLPQGLHEFIQNVVNSDAHLQQRIEALEASSGIDLSKLRIVKTP